MNKKTDSIIEWVVTHNLVPIGLVLLYLWFLFTFIVEPTIATLNARVSVLESGLAKEQVDTAKISNRLDTTVKVISESGVIKPVRVTPTPRKVSTPTPTRTP